MSATTSTKHMLKRQMKKGYISDNLYPFTKYSKIYLRSNENIDAYLKLLEEKNPKRALCVLSSGDHVFNLVLKGVLGVTAFDTNILTNYFALGLKQALIERYKYEDYLNVFATLIDERTPLKRQYEIINDVLYYMIPEHREFWLSIIDYSILLEKKYKTNLNLLHMISIDGDGIEIDKIKEGNPYLKNEENYNKLKENLKHSLITFVHADALKLPNNIKEKYDVIILSNILNFFYSKWGLSWGYDKLKSYNQSLSSLLNEDGITFLNYNYYNKGLNNIAINGSFVRQEDIINSDLESHTFKNNLTNETDALILNRKIK